MLGEIAGNYTENQVLQFFQANGIDSTDLDVNQDDGSGVIEVLLNNGIDLNKSGMEISGFDAGAYHIVVDCTDFPRRTDESGVDRVINYSFYLFGFGADDSIEIYKPGAVTVLPGMPDLNADIHAQAVGGVANGQFDITLMGVLSSPSQLFNGYDGPVGFNNLPVGDISVVW